MKKGGPYGPPFVVTGLTRITLWIAHKLCEASFERPRDRPPESIWILA